MAYNMMTCSGFDTGFFGGCSMAWLIVGLLFFEVLILNRQLNDLGIEYDMVWGFGGFIPFLLLMTFTGSVKWALVIGVVSVALLGIAGRYIYDFGVGDSGY